VSGERLSPLRVVQSGLCIGCGSCAVQSGPGASLAFNRYGELQPSKGTGTWIRDETESLARTCPFSPSALNENELAAGLFPDAIHYETAGRIQSAYVGHCDSDGFRDRGSSGGMVSWLLEELLKKDLVDGVAHVVPVMNRGPHDPFFRYRISSTSEEIRQGAKSRYFPVEMSGVLKEIRERPGRYAVVGVPCFIKAIQLLRREDPVVRSRVVYTVGLFCGHMKSALFAEGLAQQMGVPIEEASSLEFRIKDPSRPASTYTAQVTLRDGSVRKRDWWNMVDGDWGAGFFQYPACNYCDDVVAETADVSFGDAWVEPYSSDGNGTNVVVVRSPEIDSLVQEGIAQSRLELKPVDEAFIVATQEAGFRQRREGLAYRLTWAKTGIRPLKRVVPAAPESPRRRLIYRSRASISAWSRKTFWIGKSLRIPSLYLRWAKIWAAFYHGFAYSRGKIGEMTTRLGLR
jgi:coenzyme F420-reducing hydrogenase beta subunit